MPHAVIHHLVVVNNRITTQQRVLNPALLLLLLPLLLLLLQTSRSGWQTRVLTTPSTLRWRAGCGSGHTRSGQCRS